MYPKTILRIPFWIPFWIPLWIHILDAILDIFWDTFGDGTCQDILDALFGKSFRRDPCEGHFLTPLNLLGESLRKPIQGESKSKDRTENENVS
jgi:hypothetical protein